MVSFDSTIFTLLSKSLVRKGCVPDRNRFFSNLPAPSPDEIEDLKRSKGPDGEKGVPLKQMRVPNLKSLHSLPIY